jgi:hypothetical protein
MSDPIRVLFDENIGKPIACAIAQLLAFYRPAPEVMHLIDFEGREGSDDRQWIPKLSEGGWIVVSGDMGRKKRDARLPAICRIAGITHFLFSGTLHNSKQFEKARAIIALWPKIVDGAVGPKGRRYAIQKGDQHPVLVAKP